MTATTLTTIPVRVGADWGLGLAPGERIVAHDLLTGERYDWGRDNVVRLGAESEPVHIFELLRPAR